MSNQRERSIPRISGSKRPWYAAIGPALITACVVFGPGSLIISSNVGAQYRYQFLWLLVLTGLLMGTYVAMAARIGVCGGASPCTLLARHMGRPVALVVGLVLCLVCTAFQFSNNLAVALAAGAFLPKEVAIPLGGAHWTLPVLPMILLVLNGVIIFFLFVGRQIYRTLERGMKVMVAVILLCFVFNLVVAQPRLIDVLMGLIPSWPEGLHFAVPKKLHGAIDDPMILLASLLGTTFSVGGAFFQGNLVREKNWSIEDYRHGIIDSLAGVAVLTGVSMIVMITAATVIPGRPARDVGELARSLEPLLGPTSYTLFCLGLFAVAMNPVVINSVIGGTIFADGLGLPARLNDRAPRMLTVIVMLIGMSIALWALASGQRPVPLIIFGQALTVVGNPLMAAALLLLANRADVMGEKRNRWVSNLLGGLGFLVVLLMAARVLWRIILEFL